MNAVRQVYPLRIRAVVDNQQQPVTCSLKVEKVLSAQLVITSLCQEVTW